MSREQDCVRRWRAAGQCLVLLQGSMHVRAAATVFPHEICNINCVLKQNVNGQLQDETWWTKLLSSCLTICVQYIERNIKIHQKKIGYSVTDVRNGCVNMYSLWIMSVPVLLMSYLRDSSNYCNFSDAYSYPTFRALLPDIPRTLTRNSAHSYPIFRALLPNIPRTLTRH
jgi:hypothetical protein